MCRCVSLYVDVQFLCLFIFVFNVLYIVEENFKFQKMVFSVYVVVFFTIMQNFDGFQLDHQNLACHFLLDLN